MLPRPVFLFELKRPQANVEGMGCHAAQHETVRSLDWLANLLSLFLYKVPTSNLSHVLTTFHFANPWAFFLLIPVLLSILWVKRRGPRFRARLVFPTDAGFSNRPRSVLPTPFKLQFWLRSITLGLLVVVIARPQNVSTIEKRQVEAMDIIICYDLSRSMYAFDFKPYRRTVARQKLSDFVDRRPDDRIGLVLFSGEAYLGVPLTTDHKRVKHGSLR